MSQSARLYFKCFCLAIVLTHAVELIAVSLIIAIFNIQTILSDVESIEDSEVLVFVPSHTWMKTFVILFLWTLVQVFLHGWGLHSIYYERVMKTLAYGILNAVGFFVMGFFFIFWVNESYFDDESTLELQMKIGLGFGLGIQLFLVSILVNVFALVAYFKKTRASAHETANEC